MRVSPPPTVNRWGPRPSCRLGWGFPAAYSTYSLRGNAREWVGTLASEEVSSSNFSTPAACLKASVNRIGTGLGVFACNTSR